MLYMRNLERESRVMLCPLPLTVVVGPSFRIGAPHLICSIKTGLYGGISWLMECFMILACWWIGAMKRFMHGAAWLATSAAITAKTAACPAAQASRDGSCRPLVTLRKNTKASIKETKLILFIRSDNIGFSPLQKISEFVPTLLIICFTLYYFAKSVSLQRIHLH